MQTTWQSRPAAAGDRRLPGLPVPPARADRAAGGVHARQLRDEAPAGRPDDGDHAAARARGDPADRASAGAAVPDLPPGGGALYAEDARHPARGLPAAPRAAGARPARAATAGAGAGRARAGDRRRSRARARGGSARALVSRALVGGDGEPLVIAPLAADQQVARREALEPEAGAAGERDR